MGKRYSGILSIGGLAVAVLGIASSIVPAPCAFGGPCDCTGSVRTTEEVWGFGATCTAAKYSVINQTNTLALNQCPANICNSSVEFTNYSAPDCNYDLGRNEWMSDGIRTFQCCAADP